MPALTAALSVRRPSGGSEKSALDFKPSALAAESTSAEKPARFLLSLRVVLPMAILLLIAAIVVPASTVFILNAYSSVDFTANRLLDVSTSKNLADVNNLMATYQASASNWGTRPSTIRAMLNNTNDLASEATAPGVNWVAEGAAAVSQFPFITSLVCIRNDIAGAPNDTTGIPAVTMASIDKFTNVTVGNRTIPKIYAFDYLDLSTNHTYLQVAVDPFSGNPLKGQTPHKYLFDKYDPRTDPHYQFMQPGSNGSNPAPFGVGRWSVEFIKGGVANSSSVLFWSFTTNFYSDSTTPNKPSHSCQSGSNVDVTVNPFLAANKPSPNAVIMFFDGSHNGRLLASSEADSVLDTANNGSFLVDTSPSAKISQLGQYLRGMSPDFTTLPKQLQTKAQLTDGEQWYISVTEMRPDNENVWFVALAIPRSDFFASIDRSIRNSIIIVVVLTVVAIAITIGMSIMLVRPLRTLQAEMGEVTNMNFSALEKGTLHQRSAIQEINNLQGSFLVMVRAFAIGIRKNYELRGGQTASPKTSPPASAHPSPPLSRRGSENSIAESITRT